MCDETKLATLRDQFIEKNCESSDRNCKGGTWDGYEILGERPNFCREPLISKCDQLNPYKPGTPGYQGYQIGCKGVTADVLAQMPNSQSTCNTAILTSVYQNWGNPGGKCQQIPDYHERGSCSYGITAGVRSVLEKSDCTPYNQNCKNASYRQGNGFMACNGIIRSYLYGL